MRVVQENLPLLLSGLQVTVLLALASLALALVVGTLIGVVRVLPLPVIPALGTAWVEFFRNSPLLVQMFIWFYGLPQLGISLPPFLAAVVALGIYTSAFVAEVVRAGIQAISGGQVDASRSLGMTYLQTMRFVVLPQAFATTVPPLGNLAIALAKNTSIASTIAVADLLYQGEVLNAASFKTYEVFAAVAVLYLVLTIPLSIGVNFLERRLVGYQR
jgi:putative glutamine transport system permease protein